MKCFYCDFTAFSGQRASVQRYLLALGAEAKQSSELTVQTLYIGGGTPSELSAQELGELFRIIAENFGPVESFAESTIEANPESLSPEKMDVLARLGIRRISLGLETAEPRLLNLIGRKHTIEDFLAVFRGARKRRFSLNVDLMYGLPTQTVQEAMSSLETVLRLEPDHVSVYGLQIEDQTLFAKRKVDPNEDLQREIFERYLDRLASAGFRHYEISNFARPGCESIHNRIYWHDGEYVGLGCGASGYVGGVRYTNKDRLADYCEALEREESPIAERESLSGKQKLGEKIFLGLRLLDGIELTPEIGTLFPHEIQSVRERGWLEIAPLSPQRGEGCLPAGQAGGEQKRRIRLTRDGVFFANRVFEEFVPPFRTPESIPAVQSAQGL